MCWTLYTPVPLKNSDSFCPDVVEDQWKNVQSTLWLVRYRGNILVLAEWSIFKSGVHKSRAPDRCGDWILFGGA